MSHVMRKPVYAICEQQSTDHPAHPRRLISTFVVHCLGNVILILAISKISRLWLASVAEQTGLISPGKPRRQVFS